MATLTAAPFSLIAGAPIIAQVSALNAAGWSVASIDNTAYTTAITWPTVAPAGLTITAASTTSITAIWSQIDASGNGGSVITGYKVYYSDNGGAYSLV